MAPLGDSPELARCWLFAGGPRLGSGPAVGARREDAALGGGPLCVVAGRDGGGMRLGPALFTGLDAGLGGGGIAEALWALLAAGNMGFSSEEVVDFDVSSSSCPFNENTGT